LSRFVTDLNQKKADTTYLKAGITYLNQEKTGITYIKQKKAGITG
jgi:hypothetical protein